MYTRVESRFWQDEKMRLVSDDARYLMLYLLTSPHRNVLGFYFLPEPYACFDLGWTTERFRKALGELLANGLVKYDETAHVVLIINFLKHNPLENHNQVKSATQKLDEIPKTPLLRDFYETVKKYADGKSHYSSLLERLEKLLGEQLEQQLPKQLHKPFGKQEKEEEKEEEEKEKEKEKEKEYRDILSSDETDDTRLTEDSLNDDDNKTINAITPKEVVELYNSICVSLPRVVTISEKRRKQIKALLKKIRDRTEIEAVFRKAEESDFLSGRSGKWNGCNFDWLINYNNFIKVLEGTYDNKEAKPKSWNVLERLYKEELEKEMNSE
ncbi:hypothetical protein [Caldanaerobacter sp.]|uniref:hypothetical protein n=1 Tax=Caldanaerobacter sp. TaxID=2930036 RepID=UPI003C74F636